MATTRPQALQAQAPPAHLGTSRPISSALARVPPRASEEAPQIDAMSLLTSLRPLDPVLYEFLLQSTFNSPTLIAELSAAAILRFASGRPRVLVALRRAVDSACLHGISACPLRFRPPGSQPSGQPFAAFIKTLSMPWLSYIELLAAGVTSAGLLVLALTQVFDEGTVLAEHNARSPAHHHWFSFEERCRASDCAHLLPRFCLDEAHAREPLWDGPPLKRICLARANAAEPSHLGFSLAWRFTGLLALEASLRIQLASIIGSWRCTRSAVSAWNVFISCEYPCAHSLRPLAEQHSSPTA